PAVCGSCPRRSIRAIPSRKSRIRRCDGSRGATIMARTARPPRSKTKKASARKASRKPAAAKARAKAKAKAAKAAKPAARDALDDMIDAAAKALAVKCHPSWMPSIKATLQVILRHAALVDEFALPDEAEPAPVFEA